MGCDGGTIPRRDELVRLKKKPEQVSLILCKAVWFVKTFPKILFMHFIYRPMCFACIF